MWIIVIQVMRELSSFDHLGGGVMKKDVKYIVKTTNKNYIDMEARNVPDLIKNKRIKELSWIVPMAETYILCQFGKVTK